MAVRRWRDLLRRRYRHPAADSRTGTTCPVGRYRVQGDREQPVRTFRHFGGCGAYRERAARDPGPARGRHHLRGHCHQLHGGCRGDHHGRLYLGGAQRNKLESGYRGPVRRSGHQYPDGEQSDERTAWLWLPGGAHGCLRALPDLRFGLAERARKPGDPFTTGGCRHLRGSRHQLYGGCRGDHQPGIPLAVRRWNKRLAERNGRRDSFWLQLAPTDHHRGYLCHG